MKITAICPRFRRRMRNTGRISALSSSAWRNRKPCKPCRRAGANELTDLPLSLGGLSAFGQFGSAYIPLTVVVNADGTSGFEFDGVLGAEALERVLAVFVRTDGPLAMEKVPQEAE